MSDDHPPSRTGPGAAGWLAKLTRRFAKGPRDRAELLEVLKTGREDDLFDRDAHRMLRGVLEVGETQVRDIMIPRPHMVVLERDADAQTLLNTIIDSGHSRFPVIGEDRDEVVGILLAKDLLRYFVEHRDEKFDIRECLRRAVFIPESKRLNILLNEFRASHNHMAIVVDEYGGVAGLITIEDVIEQIVGDIDDEHDIEDEEFIQQDGEDRYTVLARTRLEEFNEYFGSELSDEEFDTIGGLIMHQLGRLPRRGESISVNGMQFKVMRADRRRIESVQVRATEAGPPVQANRSAI